MIFLTINAEDWYNGFVSAEDKDWDRFEYRVETMLIPMLDELDKRHVGAVVFCTGWLAEKHPEAVLGIVRRGHEIGCNGYWHIDPMKMSIDEFREDALSAKKVLEKVCGKTVRFFRAANFSIDEERLKVLAELGFQFDSSMMGERPFAIGDVIEYPIAKYKGKVPFSGGGFFRLMPYRLIRKFMKEKDYVMTYFHPRDFDAEQPKWQGLGMKDKFLSYVGVKGGFAKYKRLLNDFNFDNLY